MILAREFKKDRLYNRCIVFLGTLVNTAVLDSQLDASEEKPTTCQVPETLSHPCTQHSATPLDNMEGVDVGRHSVHWQG